MAMIPLPGAITYRGRTAKCGICGCESNLWSSNSSRLEGRLVCPGRLKYPNSHKKLSRLLDRIADERFVSHMYERLVDRQLEEYVIDIQRMRAKFKSVESDVIIVENNA